MGRAEGQKEAQEVPTLQLFQPPTPKLAKPAKKSKPRRPKTAFEDRPLAEQAIPVKPSSNLKHSNPKQTAHQIDETDTTEHFRQLFQGDQASHLRRQQRPDNVYEFSEPELEPPQLQPSDTRSNDDPANVSLDHDELDEGENASFVDLGSDDHSVAVPSVVAPSPAAIAAKQAVFEGPTVEIPLVTVRSMMMDMASKNWTGHGRRWMEEALDAVSFDGPTNATVQECWECLIDLRRKWAKVPRYPKLARQYLFAQQEADATRKDTKSVLSLISEVCEQLVQEQDRGNRETLQHDVVNFIVPWLVVLLRQFALLGGSTKKEGGQRQLPDVGTFIEPAVQLLAHACRWLQYINTALANVINSDLEAWAENKGPTMSLLTVNVAERRLGLISKITDFKEQVHKALEYFKDVREEPIRRAKIAQREAEIRLKKEQEEEAERQRREARAEAMRKSNERLRQAPDPMVEKWHRKVEHEEQLARFLAGQTTFVSTQRAVPHHQPVQGKAVQRDEFDGYFSSSPGSPRSGGGPAAPRRDGDAVRQARHGIVSTPQLARAEPPLFIGNDDGQSVAGPSARKWEPEEDEFLIAELQSRSGRPLRSNDFRLWAEVLDREVSEIQREVTRLKVATRMVAEERGMRIPPWAEEPDSW
ncbi:hypothetical protein DL546_006149 [Coniochaeta pulveracea]|uniref:Uncharacterized protein n=1 Tax=Coniochaeta pulveracea TaxID=177199 RepID=A0A420YAD9_9PEZI|nr:hypothetical protein DL546_006149 [Coniochaeta pulveracea]